jgi:hypothetical protein
MGLRFRALIQHRWEGKRRGGTGRGSVGDMEAWGGGAGVQHDGSRPDGRSGGVGCHTPFRERGNEASIRVPRMFKSHAWQQHDKQMHCY